jgi:hypothetical protein
MGELNMKFDNDEGLVIGVYPDGTPTFDIFDAAHWNGSEEEAQAIAHMVGAATEMYEALKELLPEGWDDSVMDHMPGVKKARLALAKAEGKS